MLATQGLSASAAPSAAPTPTAYPGQLPPLTGTGQMLVVKDGNIWLLKDGKFRALTTGQRYCCANWSPNAQQIAVAEVGENHSDIVVMDANGKRLRQLTYNWSKSSVRDCVWARTPIWSPDGSTIAYVTDLGGTRTRLWMVGANSPGAGRLVGVPPEGWDVDYLSYSPEGDKLALTGFDREVGQIYVLEINSGRWTKLTSIQGGSLQPAWSPDGRTIAFVARDGNDTDLWVMNADGSGQTKLTKDGVVASPEWSPDGKQIAYLSGRPLDLRAGTYVAGSAEFKTRDLTSGSKLEGPSGISWAR